MDPPEDAREQRVARPGALEPGTRRRSGWFARARAACAGLVSLGIVLAAAAFVLMLPASFVAYTSVGFDLRRHAGTDWINRAVRLQWPGDGTVGIVVQRVRKPRFEEPLDRWDLAVRFLQPPVRRAPASRWNRAGFWWSDAHQAHGDERIRTLWVGVPSWLSALVALPVLVGALSARRARRSGNADSGP